MAVSEETATRDTPSPTSERRAPGRTIFLLARSTNVFPFANP